jgi:hypothetical protein
LPLSQRNADRNRNDSGDEWDPPEVEFYWHYNVTLFNTSLFGRRYFSNPPTAALNMKIFVAVAFILIIASLGSALVFLMKDKGKSNRTVKALALRVGFSIALFILILIANHFGWIQPTGIR